MCKWITIEKEKQNNTTNTPWGLRVYVHKKMLFRGHYVRELKIFPSSYYLKF